MVWHNSNDLEASSSNGRAADSKSDGWGFESLLACHEFLPLGSRVNMMHNRMSMRDR